MRGFRFENCSNIFVISGTSDKLSESFFLKYLDEAHSNFDTSNIKFLKTLRTNEVLQSKISSIGTTLRAFAHTVWLIYSDLLGTSHFVSNGPGICIPYFYIFWFLNKLTVTKVKLVYIESWCRVRSVSLTGKLAKYVVSEYIVHWPEQTKLVANSKYIGQVI